MTSQEQVDVLSFLLDKYPRQPSQKIEKFEEEIKDKKKINWLMIVIILFLLISILFYFDIISFSRFSKN